MSGLYISYRRSDNPNVASVVSEHLAGEYGAARVFSEGDPASDRSIPSRARRDDFESLVARNLTTACVMVVIVGPAWLAPDAEGRSRLFQDDDYVRLELVTALERGIEIVPAFVGGATGWPAKSELPERLSGLLEHDGVRLRNDRLDIDLRNLAGVVAGPMAAHADGPTAEDLLHPALGFTPITLASGAALGAFEALRLQTTYEQVKQALSAAGSVSACARRDRACQDAFAPIIDKARFQMAPDIAPGLERAARQACRLKPYQPIIAAVDLSLMRWGRPGLILTDAGLFHYGDGGPVTFLANADLAAGPVDCVGGAYITVGPIAIPLPSRVDPMRVLSFVQAAASVAERTAPAAGGIDAL